MEALKAGHQMNWLAHTVCLKERSNDSPELEDPSSFSGLAHERQDDFGRLSRYRRQIPIALS